MANPGSLGYKQHGALPVRQGGTGLRSIPKGAILYAIETNVVRALDIGADAEVLTLASGLPSWAAAGAAAAHDIEGASHTLAGATSGEVMRATGATTFAFGSLILSDLPAIAFADLSDYPADASGHLANDGAGNLSWAAAAGGGTVSGTGTVNVVAKWSTGGADIEDSALTDTGSVLTYGGASLSIDTLAWLVDDVTIGFGYAGMWFHEATPSGVNYSLAGNGTELIINAQTGGEIEFRINNVNIATIDASRLNLVQDLRIVDGTTNTLSGTIVSGYGGLWLDAGTPGTTNYTLLNDGTSETLLNAVGGAAVKIRVNNVDVALFPSTGMTMVDGSNTTPGYGFSGDPGNGMYLSAANTLAWATAAVERMTLDATALTITGGFDGTQIRLSSTTDVTLSSTGHAFQVGADASTNIVMDNNEIQARNNGAAGDLTVQAEGGNLWISADLTAFGGDTALNGIRYGVTQLSTSTTLDGTHHTIFYEGAIGDETLTLPSAPDEGRVYVIVFAADVGGNLIIARNGKLIDAAASDITMTAEGEHRTLVYDDTVGTWWTI